MYLQLNFSRSFKTLIYKKILERVDTVPNFKKQNEDYRLNFDIRLYVFPYIELKI